ncbi:ABC transporter ATP-binding protein [Pseudorhodoferax sp.]|uniref:ABC transporter ATP-binding protein n=1 Tax=Pseudorhodoferax sp. TaxID=1993553 RepID=UPI002DD62267|nr:ABC transporter ATP-binding protein [Pseudorhodoferax sp.]
MSGATLLELREVGKSFGGVHAVTALNMEVRRGEVLGLIGPNGAGKTTVFNLVSGLQKPSSGSIRLDGHEIGGLRPDQVCRRGIARTFQTASFLPGLTVRENVRLAAEFREPAKRQARSSAAVVADALARTELAEVADEAAELINVSQQKRLEIARAIATEPQLLMTDEIVAGLNPAETDGLLKILTALNRDGMTLVFVEHDVRAVLSVSHRLVVLAQGKLLAEGEPKAVARSPEVIRVYLGSRYAGNR